MREILFRGIRKDNDEWIEGNVLVPRICGDIYIAKQEAAFHCIHYAVNPETVGQYTGRKDGNYKKIFEGDICELASVNFVVEFTDSKWNFRCLSGYYCEPDFHKHCADSKIVGNIWDNPEFMEEKI